MYCCASETVPRPGEKADPRFKVAKIRCFRWVAQESDPSNVKPGPIEHRVTCEDIHDKSLALAAWAAALEWCAYQNKLVEVEFDGVEEFSRKDLFAVIDRLAPKVPDPNTRAAILEEAAQIVDRDRNATHGEPEDAFAIIAQRWSVTLSQIVGQPMQIEPWHVGLLMADFKAGRIIGNPAHRDSWADVIGYLACAAELALREARDDRAD